jgi:sugar phosphate isomerase/epimerase
MKYAICNETFADWPLGKALDLAVSTGYTGWEVAPFTLSDDLSHFSTRQRSDYRRQVESSGLEIIGLHWLLAKTQGLHLTTMDCEVRKRTSEYMSKLIDLCAELGGRLMVLGSPQQRNVPEGQSIESAMANAAEVIRAVVPRLESQSVKIAVEPLGRQEGNFLNTAKQARQLIDMIASPQVQLHLDVKAMSDEGTPIAEIVRDNADAMIHFHANDPNRRGPGMGDVDFVPIFSSLKQIGYRGWVSVEVFDYSPGIECLVVESMQNMRRAMAKVEAKT